MKIIRKELGGVNEFLDEAIKLGVQMDLEKEVEQPILTAKDLDRMNIPQPPSDMYERIMKQVNASEKNTVKKPRMKKVCLIAAIITTLLVSALSVQAVRVYIYNIGVQIIEGGANLFGTNVGEPDIFDVEDEEAYAQGELALGHKLLKPAYLPKEIKFEEIRIYEDYMVKFLFANDDNSKIIRFTQEIILGGISTGTMLDTEDPIIFQDNINGCEITICKREQREMSDTWLLGMWSDGEMLYTIDSNFNKDELIKIIKNLK